MSYIDLSQIEEKELVSGFIVKFVHSENMTFAYWTIKAGSSLPEHSHPHEQVANIIKGKFEFTIDGATQIINPGTTVIIPSNAKHSGKAITDCFIIDVFYPIREDYK
ncbi:MAG: cupin domain-containing protein [Candidatus Hermodarchaeota archaeon]